MGAQLLRSCPLRKPAFQTVQPLNVSLRTAPKQVMQHPALPVPPAEEPTDGGAYYGSHDEDSESQTSVSGFIVNDLAATPSGGSGSDAECNRGQAPSPAWVSQLTGPAQLQLLAGVSLPLVRAPALSPCISAHLSASALVYTVGCR